MTNEEIIAKQAAIIQMQEIEISTIENQIDEMKEREYHYMQSDMQRNVFLCQSKEMNDMSIKMLENTIECLQYKINKKRPKFIMIINKRKHKNGHNKL